MPRLLLFGTCKKVILDRIDNNISLVSLINSVTVTIPIGDEIAKETVAPYDWGAGARWMRVSGDEQKTYQAKVQILNPDGDLQGSFETEPFLMNQPYHDTGVVLQGMSIGYPGMHTVTLSLREVGMEEWQEFASNPLEIIHERIIQ